jgi:membrane associated rhomboid family serine protease
LVIPIADDNRARRTFPGITYSLILINAIIFFMELAFGDPFIEQWSFVPARFLANPGADFITIFSSMFMHAGWLHIIGNMLYLFIFGDNVEDQFGHFRFLFFYLLCGVTATFAQLAFSTDSTIPSLGASGAIAGVLGAYIFMFPLARVTVLMGFIFIPLPALVVIGFWIVLQVFSGIGSISDASQTGGVAYFAHIGGFFFGLIMAPVFRLFGRRR